MKINSIYLENFKIFGPKGVTLDFENTSELIQMVGPNGVGKTSIGSGIIYGLYGKNPEGNISDLPNWMNPEDMLVIINITAKGNEIEIERSRSSFTIKINGKEWEQAGKSNMQDFLEREYYDLPYYTFKNILILSINDFKSFLTMTPKDKRKIVDKIFGFSLVNEMRELNKDYLKSINKEINNIQVKVEQLEKNINESEQHLEKIKKEINQKNTNKSEILEQKIKEKQEIVKNAKEKIEKLNDLKNKVHKKLKERSSSMSSIKYSIKNIKEKIKLYKNEKCPTCNSDLETEYHQALLKKYEEEEKDYLEKLEVFEEEIKEYDEKKNKINTKLKKIENHLSSINSQVYSLNQQFKNVQTDDSNVDKIEHLKNLVDNFNDDKKENTRVVKNKKKKERFLQIVDELLSENGIKSIAIKTILPKLNVYVQEEIRNMHLKYNASFDSNFDVKLTYFGEEISPKALSEGEKKKYDFVILISILKLIKIKYQNLNLLFLDEIFSSIDSDGKYSILQILRDFIDEFNMSAIVINHSELPAQFFNKKIKLTNDSTYSSLEVEDI